MPAGRILLKAISESKKLAALKTDGARLLYTWLIPHVDVNGCFSGDVEVIKGQIFTRLKKTNREIESSLGDLESVGLIVRYESNGDRYIFLPTFEEKQPHLNKDREGKTRIPLPTPEQLKSNSGPSPDKLPLKEKEKEKVKENTPSLAGIPPEIIEEAKTGITRIFTESGHSDLLTEDFLQFLIALSCEYRDLDLEDEIKAKFDWWSKHPLSTKSNLRLQFRNWFRLARKYEAERSRERRVGARPPKNAEELKREREREAQIEALAKQIYRDEYGARIDKARSEKNIHEFNRLNREAEEKFNHETAKIIRGEVRS